jgi:hypothetical protein
MMCWKCSSDEGDKKSIWSFGAEICTKSSTWKKEEEMRE